MSPPSVLGSPLSSSLPFFLLSSFNIFPNTLSGECSSFLFFPDQNYFDTHVLLFAFPVGTLPLNLMIRLSLVLFFTVKESSGTWVPLSSPPKVAYRVILFPSLKMTACCSISLKEVCLQGNGWRAQGVMNNKKIKSLYYFQNIDRYTIAKSGDWQESLFTSEKTV